MIFLWIYIDLCAVLFLGWKNLQARGGWRRYVGRDRYPAKSVLTSKAVPERLAMQA